MRATSPSRRTSALVTIQLVALGHFFGLTGGCSTDAIAIQQCREVEFLRCEASVSCGIVDADEVDSCKRFYDHHCLHGIAGPEEPSADEQETCLAHIEDAWDAAEKTRDDEDEDVVEEHEAACAVIAAPWDDEECDYLEKTEAAGGASSESEEEKDK